VQSSSSVRDLGIYIDAALSMRRHIDVIAARCFCALRQLCSVRQYVPLPVRQMLVTSLVLSRIDYDNCLLVGLTASQLRRLQSVQNAAARLIYNLRRYDHVTYAFICLHWLRVHFKVAVLVYTVPFMALRQIIWQAVLDPPLHGLLELRSVDRLAVPRTRLGTVGAKIWNNLPSDVISSPS
jgi:hypothetical protein